MFQDIKLRNESAMSGFCGSKAAIRESFSQQPDLVLLVFSFPIFVHPCSSVVSMLFSLITECLVNRCLFFHINVNVFFLIPIFGGDDADILEDIILHGGNAEAAHQFQQGEEGDHDLDAGIVLSQ